MNLQDQGIYFASCIISHLDVQLVSSIHLVDASFHHPEFDLVLLGRYCYRRFVAIFETDNSHAQDIAKLLEMPIVPISEDKPWHACMGICTPATYHNTQHLSATVSTFVFALDCIS